MPQSNISGLKNISLPEYILPPTFLRALEAASFIVVDVKYLPLR